MTNPNSALLELADKGADVDMLRQMVQFMAQRLMDMDVEGRCGAGYDEKNPERLNSRNGYRERQWDRSGSACLNSFTPRDKETTGGLNRCRVVHGGGRRLRRTGRRGGQLGEHQGFSFYAAACIDGSIAQ